MRIQVRLARDLDASALPADLFIVVEKMAQLVYCIVTEQ
jgi:hypothetical protein